MTTHLLCFCSTFFIILLSVYIVELKSFFVNLLPPIACEPLEDRTWILSVSPGTRVKGSLVLQHGLWPQPSWATCLVESQFSCL